MAGILGILSIGRSGLLASQQAVEVTSNNIANVHTPGYTRQRVDQVAAPSVYLPPTGHFGTGTMVHDVTRLRDGLLDRVYRNNAGAAGGARSRRDALQQLENVFGEPSPSGLAAGLDQFWNAWSDLASNPTSLPARAVAQQRGAQVATQLNRMAAQIDQLSTDGRHRAGTMVAEVNTLVGQVADLNREIVAAESGGHTAGTLRDARDRVLDSLAEFGDVQVIEASNGSVGVHFGGRLLVDAADPHELALAEAGGRWQVAVVGSLDRPFATGGALQATLDAVNETYPRAMASLDALAGGLVDSVNAVHESGVVFDGTTPPPAAPEFFRTDAAATSPDVDYYRTARGIQLGTQVAADPANIAASDATATGPSNNAVAMQLSMLRDTPVTVSAVGGGSETDTLANIYRRLVTTTGLHASTANSDAVAQETLTQGADARRMSMSGVSQDEELANLIKFQQAYAAAARLITVADELAQTVINIGR